MKASTFGAALTVVLALAWFPWKPGCAQELDEYCGCVSDSAAELNRDTCWWVPPSPLWMRAEYVHAWISDSEVAPLVTTSPNGTTRTSAGVLGEPGTEVLFGDESIGGAASGVRGSVGLRLGHYFDCLADWQVETSLMWLGSTQHPDDFAAASGGEPILARPFFDASSGTQNSQLVAFPGVVEGGLSAEVSNELQSVGISLRRTMLGNECFHVEWLAGYRYFNFNEQLAIDQAMGLDPGTPPDEQISVDVFDRIRARSRFDGGELGLVTRYHRDRWEFELLAKIGLGQARRVFTVDNLTVVTDPNLPKEDQVKATVYVGRYTASDFGALPEIDFSVRRQITPSFTLTAGYSLIFLSEAIRLGDQIDITVNSADLFPELPLARASGSQSGPPQSSGLVDSSLWVQGIHVGLEW
jgi:hypothetical protein